MELFYAILHLFVLTPLVHTIALLVLQGIVNLVIILVLVRNEKKENIFKLQFVINFILSDIDECAVNKGDCDPHVECINTVGGRTCTPCPFGYYGDSYTICHRMLHKLSFIIFIHFIYSFNLNSIMW